VAILEARAPRRGAGHLWAFQDGSKITIGRLAFLPEGGFVIMPRNPDQAPRVERGGVDSGLLILGRVACLAMVTGT
jgi:hypothetical protein